MDSASDSVIYHTNLVAAGRPTELIGLCEMLCNRRDGYVSLIVCYMSCRMCSQELAAPTTDMQAVQKRQELFNFALPTLLRGQPLQAFIHLSRFKQEIKRMQHAMMICKQAQADPAETEQKSAMSSRPWMRVGAISLSLAWELLTWRQGLTIFQMGLDVG